MMAELPTFAVFDLTLESAYDIDYSLGIFASGYERRCRYSASKLDSTKFDKCVVFGFEEHSDHPERIKNDEYFEETWKSDYIKMSQGNELPIYEYLNKQEFREQNDLHLLIDYSSMSRLWYAGLLNWIRNSPREGRTVVDFIYSLGIYRKRIGPLVINDILAIPGCEGVPVPSLRTAAIFCLGYDGESTLTVYDKLQADTVYAIIANPGSSDDAPNIARQSNLDFLQERITTLEYPLRHVATTYSKLSEIVSTHRGLDNVVLVPMGPKPHILASILLAIRFPETTLLRVSGSRVTRTDEIESIEAQGEIILTRVEFL